MSAPIIHHLLIQALIAVEAGGSANPDRAEGDYVNGVPTAHGCLQISDIMLADVNRITGSAISQDALYDRHISVNICLVYLSHYGTEERLGHPATSEDLARIWNGGPRGAWKASTEIYWLKVKAQLDRFAGVWNASYTEFTPARLPVDDEPKHKTPRSQGHAQARIQREGSAKRLPPDNCRPAGLVFRVGVTNQPEADQF